VLTLFPFDPRGCGLAGCDEIRAGEPCLDRSLQRRVAPEPYQEGQVVEFYRKSSSEVTQRPKLVELAQPVEPVAGLGSVRNDEPDPLEVAEHACGPARTGRRIADREPLHGRNFTTSVLRFRCVLRIGTESTQTRHRSGDSIDDGWRVDSSSPPWVGCWGAVLGTRSPAERHLPALSRQRAYVGGSARP